MGANARRALGDNARQPTPVWVQPLTTLFVWAVVIGLLLQFFGAAKLILLGLLAASAVAALLRPLVARLPGPIGIRAVGVWAGMMLLLAGTIILASYLVAQPVRHELQNLPQAMQDINDLIRRWAERIGVGGDVTLQSLADQLIAFLGGDSAASLISQTTSVTTNAMIGLAFVFIGSLYMLIAPAGQLTEPLLRMLPAKRARALRGALVDFEPLLRWWIIGTLVSVAIVGAVSWVGFAIVGLRFAAAMALLMAIGEIVPTVGPLLAFVLALMVAATQGATQIIGVTVIYAIIQLAESYVLLPLIMRKAVHVPPVVTLFTVVLWGKVLGVAGLLLAIPIDLFIWVIADHFLLRNNGTETTASVDHADPEKSR